MLSVPLTLYVVLYIFGEPIMVMRWANDELLSCTDASIQADAGIDAAFADPEKHKNLVFKGRMPERKDVQYRCEYYTFETKPKIKDPVSMK